MNIERSTVYLVGAELCRCLWDIVEEPIDNSISYSLQGAIWSKNDLSIDALVSDECRDYEYDKAIS
jgi:hypothetical protein